MLRKKPKPFALCINEVERRVAITQTFPAPNLKDDETPSQWASGKIQVLKMPASPIFLMHKLVAYPPQQMPSSPPYTNFSQLSRPTLTSLKTLQHTFCSPDSGTSLHNFFFFFFRVILEACGGSQARGQIGTAAAGLHHSHSKDRSKPV